VEGLFASTQLIRSRGTSTDHPKYVTGDGGTLHFSAAIRGQPRAGNVLPASAVDRSGGAGAN